MNTETINEEVSTTFNDKQKKHLLILFLLHMLLLITVVAAGVVAGEVVAAATVAVAAAAVAVAAGGAAGAGAGEVVAAAAVAVAAVAAAVAAGILVIFFYFFTSLSTLTNIQKEEYKKAKKKFILSALLYVIYTVTLIINLSSFIPKENTINLLQYETGETEIITEARYFQPFWKVKSFTHIPKQGNIKFKNIPENIRIEGTYKLLENPTNLTNKDLKFLIDLHKGIDIFQSSEFHTQKLKEFLTKKIDGNIRIKITKLMKITKLTIDVVPSTNTLAIKVLDK
jgi:hypothetical protein